MERKCLACEEKLTGRADKKFCDDACRNSFNNKYNKVTKNLLRNVNNRLRKNYRILETLNPHQKTRVTRNRLVQRGFDFTYITSIYMTQAGTAYYFVYDQGYLPLEGGYYALVRKYNHP